MPGCLMDSDATADMYTTHTQTHTHTHIHTHTHTHTHTETDFITYTDRYKNEGMSCTAINNQTDINTNM